MRAEVGLLVIAEGDDLGADAVGALAQQCESAGCRAAARPCRRAPGPAKISALASAIASTDGEVAQVHRLDRGDDGHVRAHHLGERRDLAGVVHADLEHAVLRCPAACAPASAARPSDCCRTSPPRASAPACARHRRSISLVPVLPTLPVTATMRALVRSARGAADGFQRAQRIGDAQQRAVVAAARDSRRRRWPRRRRP